MPNQAPSRVAGDTTLTRTPERAAGRDGAEADPARSSRRQLLLLIAGFVALIPIAIVLGIVADAVHEQEAIALDGIVTPLLHSYASPTLDAVMNLFTDLGSTPVVVPLFVIAIVLLLVRRHRREAIFLTVATAGSVLLNQTLKLLFERPRPVLAWSHVIPEYSFPSGHAMNSFVFYVALGLIVWTLAGRRAGLIAVTLGVVLAALIGVSRIYLGYHYFSDVIGGLCAGAAWLIIVSFAMDGGVFLRLWRARGTPS